MGVTRGAHKCRRCGRVRTGCIVLETPAGRRLLCGECRTGRLPFGSGHAKQPLAKPLPTWNPFDYDQFANRDPRVVLASQRMLKDQD